MLYHNPFGSKKYSGYQVEYFDNTQAVAVYKVADYLQIDAIKNYAKIIMLTSLDCDTVVEVLRLAVEYDDRSLTTQCLDFITCYLTELSIRGLMSGKCLCSTRGAIVVSSRFLVF